MSGLALAGIAAIAQRSGLDRSVSAGPTSSMVPQPSMTTEPSLLAGAQGFTGSSTLPRYDPQVPGFSPAQPPRGFNYGQPMTYSPHQAQPYASSQAAPYSMVTPVPPGNAERLQEAINFLGTRLVRSNARELAYELRLTVGTIDDADRSATTSNDFTHRILGAFLSRCHRRRCPDDPMVFIRDALRRRGMNMTADAFEEEFNLP